MSNILFVDTLPDNATTQSTPNHSCGSDLELAITHPPSHNNHTNHTSQDSSNTFHNNDNHNTTSAEQLANRVVKLFLLFFHKCLGKSFKAPPNLRRSKPLHNALFSFVCSVVGIMPLIYVDTNEISDRDWAILFVPLAASCVLVFGQPQSPFAQPPNLIFGHVISAVVGVALRKTMDALKIGDWAAPFSMPISLLLMDLSRTVHPPGCSTALLAASTSSQWRFVLSPVLLGSVWILFVGILANNMHPNREYRYPMWWSWW